jgi:hypothetical protein
MCGKHIKSMFKYEEDTNIIEIMPNDMLLCEECQNDLHNYTNSKSVKECINKWSSEMANKNEKR